MLYLFSISILYRASLIIIIQHGTAYVMYFGTLWWTSAYITESGFASGKHLPVKYDNAQLFPAHSPALIGVISVVLLV
jgi:hypothetical protein